DFFVLTGFLGSGKTTLLRDFLDRPEAADTAVIVNEVGEIGLDGIVLREGGDLPMATLSNGCVCCQIGSEVATFEEAVAQWAAAHRIVATKSDLVAPSDLASAPSSIAAVNPLAEMI